jgi:dihydroorotase
MADDTIVIKNGRVIDPARKFDDRVDVLVSGGKIAAVGKFETRASHTIDAEGLLVCPGLIDIHVHLREPGNEDAETIASGSAAAVAGGFTSVCCMPNTHPPLDTEASINFVYRQAAEAGLCNVFPIGAITKGRKGEELAEMGVMLRAGAVAFSDDGCAVASSQVMQKAMQYVTMFDRVLIEHCEDPQLAGGVMNAGVTSTRLGLPGVPAIAEELIIQRDIRLASVTGARLHIAHISTAEGVEMVRQAKRRGVRVTAEVCPHHLLLTDEACSTYDTNFKMNPPLRTAEDVEACRRGCADGTIDCLVTDHAPHRAEEKEHEFLDAPFGIIGLECALPLFARALIETGLMDWPAVIAMLTARPARIVGLRKGTLAVDADADVTLIDPNHAWHIDVRKFRSKSANCPFDGESVTGKALLTLVGGAIKYLDPSASVRSH